MLGPRDIAEFWLVDFDNPFIVPIIEGRGALELEGSGDGGAMDIRFGLEGGSRDFRPVLEGVPFLEEVPDDAVEPSCLVGDLLGDFDLHQLAFY